MKPKMYDRYTNPAAYIKVMPCFKNQPLPVAVFVRHTDCNFWQQYSRGYWYKKCAHNFARGLEIEHPNYYNLENDRLFNKAEG